MVQQMDFQKDVLIVERLCASDKSFFTSANDRFQEIPSYCASSICLLGDDPFLDF